MFVFLYICISHSLSESRLVYEFNCAILLKGKMAKQKPNVIGYWQYLKEYLGLLVPSTGQIGYIYGHDNN
jgi:hypothetical protein